MANNRTVTYTIKVDDSDVKKLSKDIKKLDTDIEVGIKVDDAEIKRINKELENEDVNIKIKVDDASINKLKSDLNDLEDIDIGGGFETAAAHSKTINEESSGIAAKMGVIAQFAETWSQISLGSTLTGLGKQAEALEEISNLEKKQSDQKAAMTDQIQKMIGLRGKERDAAKGKLDILKKEREQIDKTLKDKKREVELSEESLSISNAREKSILFMAKHWKSIAGVAVSLVTAFVAMNGEMQDIATASGRAAVAWANSGKSMAEAYRNSKRLLRIQRLAVVDQARFSGRIQEATLEADKQQVIADDTTKTFIERNAALDKSEEATKKALKAARALRTVVRLEGEALVKNAITAEEIAQAEATRRTTDQAAYAEEKAIEQELRNITKDRNELAQDEREQELDWLIDATDVRIQGLLEIANSEESTSAQTRKAYEEILRLNQEALTEQLKALNITREQFDIIGTLQPAAQVDYLKGLGLSEILATRLLEVYKEQLLVQRDIAKIYVDRQGRRAAVNELVTTAWPYGDAIFGSGVMQLDFIKERNNAIITEEMRFYAQMMDFYGLDAENYAGYAEIKSDINRMLAEDTLNAFGNLFGALGDLMDDTNEKEFKAMKALRYGEAVMNMAAGITNALATGAPYVRWVEAAAIGVAGLAQIRSISQMQFGDTGGGTSSSGVAKPSVSNTAPVTTGRALYEFGKQSTPIQAFVVHSELDAASLADSNRSGTVDL